MKRILLLIKGLDRGGAEQIVATAAPHLDSSRFDYQVAYLLPERRALVGQLEGAGVPVACLNGGRGLGWVGRLRDLVAEQRIDLVHAHSPVPAIFARLALRGTRIVYTEHNVWQRYHRATYWANLLTYFRNDRVFAVSDEVRRSIRYPRAVRFLPTPTVETLYHGIDEAAVARWRSPDGLRAEFGIAEDAPLVGTVANFKVHKGHHRLLLAALKVREAMPDARFVLVGRGPLEADIRRQADELGLNGTVLITGFREDALRFTAACDVFALPSEHEGLPIALLEAMALGKPTAATRAGGIPEVVEDGREGLLVESTSDPSALAGVILTLLGDPQLRARMGRAAQIRARHFDIRKAVHRMEQVYQELLA
jgi:glycosyltransferase involved in cell wall biosynthesis